MRRVPLVARYALAAVFIVNGVLSGASSAWDLVDNTSCTQHPTLCVTAQFGLIFTTLFFWLSVVSIVLGFWLMRATKTDDTTTSGGDLLGAAVVAPTGLAGTIYLISSPDAVITAFGPVYERGLLVISFIWFAGGVSMFIIHYKERKKC